ncbi:unnamed protein product [Caretta caretta]
MPAMDWRELSTCSCQIMFQTGDVPKTNPNLNVYLYLTDADGGRTDVRHISQSAARQTAAPGGWEMTLEEEDELYQ